METLEILLDGYTDLPPGKIANVVTYLEMLAPPVAAGPSRTADLRVPRWSRTRTSAGTARPSASIGEAWLWFSPLVMPEAKLAALLGNPLA